MEHKQLIQLIDLFYRKGFSFKQGIEIFGQIKKEKEDRIILNPHRGSNIEEATLEKFEIQAGKPSFLEGLYIKFETPIKIDFKDLAKRFGPEVEMPRLKPHQDIPYRFIIKEREFDGYILLGVTKLTSSSKRNVKSIILRRFPPTYQ